MNLPHRTEGRLRHLPLLVYDGDCGFCARSVRFIEHRVKPKCTITAWQFAELHALGVTELRAQREMLWITRSGTVYGGSRALAKALLSAGGGWRILGGLLLTVPLRWLSQGVYRLIAVNRHRLPGSTAACAVGVPPGRPTQTPQPSVPSSTE
ncbi:thiol-disulfide oxidoreductase DCC family protein [Streptomyces sp. NPDC002962]|uniref:thiol-disulfide oxidoreductase DCC family protein n=1 Tax=Streptomyces sp. NPDC002962 TaxID=3364674 RepID=UPI00368564E3